jgi:hypothetical protein
MEKLTKLLFAPLAALGGVLAGLIGKKLFRAVWSLVDKEEPPEPAAPGVPWSKVVAALALEGAISRTTRGVVDRSARQVFASLTGLWPGEHSEPGTQAGADSP